MTHRPIIGVMGSGNNVHCERARALGLWLAKAGFHLLTGGGGGVMQTVSKAFCDVSNRKGLVIGVFPVQRVTRRAVRNQVIQMSRLRFGFSLTSS